MMFSILYIYRQTDIKTDIVCCRMSRFIMLMVDLWQHCKLALFYKRSSTVLCNFRRKLGFCNVIWHN